MLKYIILGFLSYRPMSGYDIETWMKVSTGHFWHSKLSQIYVTLKKMEQDNLVVSEVEEQDDRPNKRIYTITDSGQEVLSRWRSTMLTEMDSKKDSLMLKVFFASPSNLDTLLSELKLQLDLHQKQKLQYEQESPEVIVEFLAEQPELLPHAKLWGLTRRYGLLYEEAYIQWLEEAIQLIENET